MCRKMKKFEKDFHISFFNLTQFFLAFELKLVIFLFTFLISCLFTIFQDSRLEQAGVGPGGANSSSEGVLANFFNSLLSKKTAGQPGTPSNQIKPTTGLDDCKSNSNRNINRFQTV